MVLLRRVIEANLPVVDREPQRDGAERLGCALEIVSRFRVAPRVYQQAMTHYVARTRTFLGVIPGLLELGSLHAGLLRRCLLPIGHGIILLTFTSSGSRDAERHKEQTRHKSLHCTRS